VIVGTVILIRPELALWLVAMLLGSGLILSVITGLTALAQLLDAGPPRNLEIGSGTDFTPDVLLLPGIGHYPQVEDPDAVAAAVREFLALRSR